MAELYGMYYWILDCEYTGIGDYNNFNKITSVTDKSGSTTSYQYDNKGNLTSIVFADGSSQQFSYNENGLIKEVNEKELIKLVKKKKLVVLLITTKQKIENVIKTKSDKWHSYVW